MSQRTGLTTRSRARRAGIPDDLVFETKPQIALAQLREAVAAGIPPGIVLDDAGDETALRESVTEVGLLHAVGIRRGNSAWAPSTPPLSAHALERARSATKIVAPCAQP